VSDTSVPPVDGSGARVGGRAQRRLAEQPAADVPSGGSTTSRADQRRQAEARARDARASRALWKAWWLYPLVGGVLVATYLGVQSAGQGSVREPTVVQTISPAP
jgi:hypothetical protein